MASRDYALTWERVFGEKSRRGVVHYLPSEAGAVIVQYDPDFRISALIPPATRPIEVEYQETIFQKTHKSPSLILSHLVGINSNYEPNALFNDPTTYDGLEKHLPWCYCAPCSHPLVKHTVYGRTRNQFYLFAVDAENSQQEIMAQPYRLNNVYDDGRCCFMRKFSKATAPSNLKQAHNRFWMDRFSPEFLAEDWLLHRCEFKIHDCPGHNRNGYHLTYEQEMRCACCIGVCRCSCECRSPESFAERVANYAPNKKYENYTAIVCGQAFISFPQSADAVFISTDAGLLESLPKEAVFKAPRFKDPFIIGLASLKDKLWEISIGDTQFHLRQDQIVVG